MSSGAIISGFLEGKALSTKRNVHRKSSRSTVVDAVIEYARAHPDAGQFTVSRELAKAGVKVSPSGVRSIWKRFGLETSYQRLTALKGEASGLALSETQLDTLKRQRRSRALKARAGLNETLTEVRRDELLQAAAKVFSKKGFNGASLREICSSAGIQPTSMYYHFRSKESLFAAVHKIGMQRTNRAIDAAIAHLRDPWEKLEAACGTAMSYVLDSSDLAVVVRVDPTLKFKPALQRQVNADRAAYEGRFRDIINDLDLPLHVDRTLFRLVLLGAINWSSTWYKIGRWTPEEIGRKFITEIFAHMHLDRATQKR